MGTSQRKLWYKSDTFEVNDHVFDEIKRIQREQGDRYKRNILCLKLYGSQDYAGLFPSVYSQGFTLPENRVRYNVTSSCVDTICSKIGKLKTKVSFLTDGGMWEAKQKAKQLTKFMFGMFTANKVWRLHQQAFRDATIFDIGVVKHYRIGNKIRSERVLPTEIHFDLVDSVYGTPTVCYQTKNIDKDTLIELFPSRKTAILASTVSKQDDTPMSLDMTNQVTVVEAWKLPSVEDGDDGRHVMVCDKGYLLDEPWEKNHFPFTFFKWAEMPVGFYAQSLVDRLKGNQIEINKILRVIQKSLHLGAVYKILLEYGSKIVKEQFNNDIGTAVYYAGTKPDIVVPKVVSEEMFRHLNWLIDKSYEETGVSQLSAAAKKPSGLDARVAMREYQDIETERFAITAQAYEDSFPETARQYIDLAKEIHAEGLDLEVVAESKKFVEKIRWSDVEIEDNEIILQRFPTSSLPNTPAGRLQYVQELIEGGLVDPKWALHLLDIPDTDSYVSLQTAALEAILDCMDQICSRGRYIPPDPHMDLETGVTLMQCAYNRGLIDEMPENRMEMLRDWMTNADALINKAKAKAQMGQTIAGAAQAGMQQTAPVANEAMAPTGGINPTDQVLTT